MLRKNETIAVVIRRAALALAAVAGLFVLPWAFVFAGLIGGAAVFSWYIEGFVAVFIAAFLAGLPLWKAAAAFGVAVSIAEGAKYQFEPRQWFSYGPIALAAAFVSAVLFFIIV